MVRSKPVRMPLALRQLLCSLLLSAGAAAGFAGEKIRISGPDDPIVLPTPEKESLENRLPFGTLSRPTRNLDIPAQVPANPQARPFRSPKLEDYLERQRNWIQDSAVNDSEEDQLKGIFGLREENPTVQLGEEMDEPGIAAGTKKGRREPLKPDSRMTDRESSHPNSKGLFGNDHRATDIRELLSSGSPGSSELYLNDLLRLNAASGVPGGTWNTSLPGSTVSPHVVNDPFGLQRSALSSSLSLEPEQPSMHIEKLLGPKFTGSVLSSSPETVNINPETIRPVNPVATDSLRGPGTLPKSFNLPQQNSLGVLTPPNALEGLRGGISGPSFSPGFQPSAPGPIMQPQPAVLEIPRRKF